MTATQCPISGLPVAHPETFVAAVPGSDFQANIARLGHTIVLVKCYGYASSEVESQLLSFIDYYSSKYLKKRSGAVFIEDYADITGTDSHARKQYISYFLNKANLAAGIIYNINPILRISFNLFKKLHPLADRAYATDTYAQAMVLALKLTGQQPCPTLAPPHIDQPDRQISRDHNDVLLKTVKRPLFSRMHAKVNTRGDLIDQTAKQLMARQYSEELIAYIASIDWRAPGISPPESIMGDAVSAGKMFDAISFIKSEIDTLLQERDAAEAVLRESETRNRLLVKHAKAGFLEYDADADRIIRVNDELLNMTGYCEQELLTMRPGDLMTGESRTIFTTYRQDLRMGKPVSENNICECVKKTGQRWWCLLNFGIPGSRDAAQKISIVVTDITSFKNTEKTLLEYQEKLKRLSIRLSMSEEKQRRTMASHLHETIGQELFVLLMQLSAFEKSLDRPEFLPAFHQMRDQLHKIIKETKTLTFDLSPPVLYDFGFQEALETLAKTIESRNDISVHTVFEEETGAISDEIKVIIYRSIKELIHNTIKHAHARKIDIMCKDSASGLEVEFRDDGVGFNPDDCTDGRSSTDGFGLFDIREKLLHLGGNLDIDSRPGAGTTIIMHVPHP
jgi:PAS domain S-box-containing protein